MRDIEHYHYCYFALLYVAITIMKCFTALYMENMDGSLLTRFEGIEPLVV